MLATLAVCGKRNHTPSHALTLLHLVLLFSHITLETSMSIFAKLADFGSTKIHFIVSRGSFAEYLLYLNDLAYHRN